jgi:methionyl-tRNA formyltransferase
MRAIFFGTPDIAVPSLDALASIAEVVGVVCQPDRPSGRGLRMRTPAVKVRASELGFPVTQPEKLKSPNFVAWLREMKADFALVLAFGRILPRDVLDSPARGCINLHASILPRYRGAAPINWAIIRGETETGITLMKMDEGLDTGPVYATRHLAIGENENAGELAVRLAGLAAAVVREDVPRAIGGELVARTQDGAAATSAPPLKKEDGRIDWRRPAAEIHNHVRGMTPWPSAFTRVGPRLLKILSTRRSNLDTESYEPGTLVMADVNGVLVACGQGTLEICTAQLEGKKPHSARELVTGRILLPGTRFE